MKLRTSKGSMALAMSGLVLLIGAPATAARLIDDFSRGTDDGWMHIDQVETMCDVPAIYDASTGEYHIESGCALSGGDDEIVAAQYVGITDDVTEETFAEGTVRAQMQHLTDATTLWISLRSWGNERIGVWGYRFEIPSDGTQLRIVRVWEHGESTPIATKTTLDLLFEPGAWLNVEASALGAELALKVWAVGAEEPAGPQITATDRVFREGALVIGLSHEGAKSAIAGLFDDILFEPAPSGDVTGDGIVDTADLVLVLASWGGCEDACPGDADGDGQVDIEDLLMVLRDWS